MSRTPTAKEYSHERLGERFRTGLSNYDTLRRVETLVDEFLTDEMIAGRAVLDVGCGFGFFSERLHRRGAKVLATDLGPRLVEDTRQRVGCEAVVADALALVEQFGREKFDAIVSSECVEHTPDPPLAIRQMARVLKPGGYLSLSTPNLLWQPVVRAASALRLRPFDGHENFLSWRTVRSILEEEGLTIRKEKGLHLFPFQFRMHGLSRMCDARLQSLRGLMINICVLAQKA
jgi:2-polyprenyl-6-hydroxyphenyl methylase/3-demethylubiquinone-9 3-methyltransferase